MTRTKPRTIRLNFIVNGEDTLIHVGLDERLSVARGKALFVSHNTGAPPERWEIRDERGVRLPDEPKVGTFDFVKDQRLFLTLMVGIGGCA